MWRLFFADNLHGCSNCENQKNLLIREKGRSMVRKNDKLAFVTSNGQLDGWCGAQESHYQIIKQLGRDVISVTGGPKGISSKLRQEGFNVIQIPFDQNHVQDFRKFGIARKTWVLLQVVRYCLSLVFVIKKHRIKVIYTVIGPAILLAPIAAKIAGIKVVTGVRGTPQNLSRWHWIIRLSDSIVVLSEEIKDTMIKSLSAKHIPNLKDKIRVVYNGVDFDLIERKKNNGYDPRRQLGISKDDTLILYPAAFRPWKGQLRFIKAVLPLLFEDKNLGSRIHIAFVGSKSNEKENSYEAQCRNNVNGSGKNGHIHFPGFQKDIWPWYRSADIVVLGSENLEGMPRVIIEAMSCSKPVVSFDVFSAKELLRGSGGGIVIPQGEEQQMADAIMALAADRSLRRDMGHKGRTFAFSHLDIKKVACAYQGLFDEFL